MQEPARNAPDRPAGLPGDYEDAAAAAARTRAALLAALAHDIKNPLASLCGHAQTLRHRVADMDPPAPPWLKERLARIDASGKRVAALVDELLDLVQHETGRPPSLVRRPTDLVTLVRWAVAEAQQATDQHVIQLEAPEAELVGRWDAGRLRRVVDNLLGNAVKYSPTGGEITVRVARGGEGMALLIVRDAGLGIPTADLPHIFEPLRRGSNVPNDVSGSGLGLASVRRIVEGHGGTVSLESREGAGTTVTVRLPLE